MSPEIFLKDETGRSFTAGACAFDQEYRNGKEIGKAVGSLDQDHSHACHARFVPCWPVALLARLGELLESGRPPWPEHEVRLRGHHGFLGGQGDGSVLRSDDPREHAKWSARGPAKGLGQAHPGLIGNRMLKQSR